MFGLPANLEFSASNSSVRLRELFWLAPTTTTRSPFEGQEASNEIRTSGTRLRLTNERRSNGPTLPA